ncbi:restriction endonuclease subunit S [Candidatus Methanoperedens nitratireducens]|uniref:Putative Type I restriction modification DNA specificity domain protein n=1 Tax=Candidatus Methanoperedens nitratireducens TaxID=1392998 RepID=A0A284VKS1_9EURY|nr:restriction endonuclease subunit S [Candidatus Methanoperedens nitroreducens]SNQ59871.1 putative Type I restriction modification DNA specificity domain protein [Candidatus Methanoperedens nitroreducens]
MKQEAVVVERGRLPEGWRWSTLGKECEINPRKRNIIEADDNRDTSFVPMEVVDGGRGIISEIRIVPFSKVKKGYTYFEENDVLFAKITPCMQNKKSAIAVGLISGYGFGTTEFHVLRCKERVIPKWVYYFIRNQRFIDEAESNFTGAVGQQRVPSPFLEKYPIIVPPFVEQQKIVDKLDKQMAQIEIMKKEAEGNIEAVKDLFYSYQKNLFESNIFQKCPKIKLVNLTTKIGSGITPNGGHSVYQKDGVPLIRSMNVHLNNFKKEGLAHISAEIDESMKNTRVIKGDVLLNITGASIGRVCVVPDEICPANVNQHVSIVRTNNMLNPYYLSYYLSNPNFQKFIMDSESGATRQALTKSKIEQFEIPAPSIEIQNQIVAQLNARKQLSEELLNKMNNQLNSINQLPNSILNEVFGQYQIQLS